ncbi:MAG: mechanosensitive ion channel family protein [Bacteroidales bacterium]|jgi:miniconductance mechanosensitive channel|nr:mechanosensitive ion channel family protein [Bacteroidales bacterium]
METTSYSIGRWAYHLLSDWGVPDNWAKFINCIILLLAVILIVYTAQYLTRKIIRFFLDKSAKITKISFLKYLSQNRFAHYLALTIPYNIVKFCIPIVFEDYTIWINPLNKLIEIYLIFMVIWLVMSIIKSGSDVLREKPAFEHKPMESYLQVIKLVLFIFGLGSAYVTITGKDITVFFATMGAASAILMLVFKDSIMGFVASIQVTINDMVRIGDWVTMPKYGADGDVVEINLTTVKVQNFDKTITTIPTYALISDSFQNWRGMENAGGRRIKRSIIIKQSSIRFIADEELSRFKKIQGISNYIDERQVEIIAHNERINADRSLPINGRNLTNAGLYRKYTEWYLKNHPGVHKNMTLMVRHLPPTDSGIPFELYVFTNTIKWVKYEEIMADIFDHLLAATKYFDLQIFEKESGGDIKILEMINNR